MNIYRIADLNIAFAPQYDSTAAFLAPYQTDDPSAQLTIHLSPTALQEEAAHLSRASEDIRESTALLRILGKQLPHFDRLVLHAAAIVTDRGAYAFIAPSGTGKTTHVQLWQKRYGEDVYILNGDRVIVHIQPHGVTAFGSPWRGKERIGQNACAPLKGLFLLTRSDDARCEPLSPTDALPHMLRAVPYPKTKEERLTVLSLLEQLCTVVPFYHLYAPLSFAAVDAALEQLEESP